MPEAGGVVMKSAMKLVMRAGKMVSSGRKGVVASVLFSRITLCKLRDNEGRRTWRWCPVAGGECGEDFYGLW